MKENRNTVCDPCERDFKRKVDELIHEGKAPSHMERTKKEHEVKSAFAGYHSEHMAAHDMEHETPHAAMKKDPVHAAAEKPAAKPRTMAGAMKTKK